MRVYKIRGKGGVGISKTKMQTSPQMPKLFGVGGVRVRVVCLPQLSISLLIKIIVLINLESSNSPPFCWRANFDNKNNRIYSGQTEQTTTIRPTAFRRRLASLGIMRPQLRPPIKPLEHPASIVPKGFKEHPASIVPSGLRGALNWASIKPTGSQFKFSKSGIEAFQHELIKLIKLLKIKLIKLV